jgi:hypothetical protein
MKEFLPPALKELIHRFSTDNDCADLLFCLFLPRLLMFFRRMELRRRAY